MNAHLLLLAILCFSLCAVVPVSAKGTWNFTLVGSLNPGSQPRYMRLCQNRAAMSIGDDDGTISSYNFTWPDSFRGPSFTLTAGNGDDHYSGSMASLVQYDSYGMIIYYSLLYTAKISVGLVDSGGNVTNFRNVTSPNSANTALIDPDYPLLYVAGSGFVGVLNISNPYTTYFITTGATTASCLSPGKLALVGARLFIPNNYAAPAHIGAVYDVGSQKIVGMFPNNYYATTTRAIIGDAGKKYVAFWDTFKSRACVHGYQPPHPRYFCAEGNLSPVDMRFVGDYLILNDFKVIKISPTVPNGVYPNYTYSFENVNIIGAVYDPNQKEIEFYRDKLYRAEGATNIFAWYNISTDTGLNIYNITESDPQTNACNKSRSLPPLFFDQKRSIVVDAKNLLPLTRDQLYVTDGKGKDYQLHQITFYVGSVSPASTIIQVYNNGTKTWQTATTFMQTALDGQSVRILPNATYNAACASNTANAYNGSITLTVKDIWLRQIANVSVPFVVLCCGNTTMTTGSDITCSALLDNLDNAARFCTSATPGYYLDALERAASPCPVGTFNPSVTKKTMRDACFSCPAGSTTVGAGSKAWTDCTCDYCKLDTNSMSVRMPLSGAYYSYRPKPWVANPHKDRPILFMYRFRGLTNSFISLSPNATNYNGSAPISTFLPQFLRLVQSSPVPLSGFTLNSSYTTLDFAGSESVALNEAFYGMWVFYWKGFMTAGVVPIDVDVKSDFTIRDRMLPFLLRANASLPDNTLQAITGIFANYTDPGVPILDIGLGSYNPSGLSTYQDAWVVNIDSYIDNNTVAQPLGPLILENYVRITRVPQQTFYVVPNNTWSVAWSVAQNSTSVTWLNNSLNVLNFTPSLESSFGLFARFVRDNGQSNASSWPEASSFAQYELDSQLIYLKVLNSSLKFMPGISFSLAFTVEHPLVVMPVSNVFNTVFNVSNNVKAYGCDPGYVINDTVSICSPCPIDTYYDSWSDACVNCPTHSGTNSSTASTSIDNCTAHLSFVELNRTSHTFGCAAGTGLTPNQTWCAPCLPEYFQPVAADEACSACPNGTTTFGMSSQNYCWNATTYSNDSGSVVCAAGYFSNVSECAACAADTYKVAVGNTSCIACAPGSSTFLRAASLQCWNSSAYTLYNDSLACNYGYYPNATSCIACDVNTYKDTVGNVTCTACDSQSTTFNQTGLGSCYDTRAYTVLNGTIVCGLGYFFQGSTCVECDVDFYKDIAGNQNCSGCPQAFSTLGQTGAMRCWSTVAYAALNGSTVCSRGFYPLDTSCVSCAADYYKQDVGNGTCSPCNAESTTYSKLGLTFCYDASVYASVNNTIVCAPGYNPVEADCVSCDVNYYKSEADNSSCIACSQGYGTRNATGQKNASDCTALVSDVGASSSSSSPSNAAPLIIGCVAGIFAITAAVLVAIVVHRKRKAAFLQKPILCSSGISRSSPISTTNPSHRKFPNSFSENFNEGYSSSMLQTRKLSSTLGVLQMHSRTTALATNTQFNVGGSLLIAFPGFLIIDSLTGYRLEKKIAEGGFAKLYSGILLDMSVLPVQYKESLKGEQCRVAIKVYNPLQNSNQNATDEQLDDLENEVTIMYALTCLPNIARLFAVSRTPQRSIIMKLYDSSVDELVHEPQNQLARLALEFCDQSWIQVATHCVRDILCGVCSMHDLKVCHLDLKPKNFLVERKDQQSQFPLVVVITDFGLARASSDLHACRSINKKITAGVSLPYAAPEAFNIVRFLDRNLPVQGNLFPAMDVYSVTVSVWEIFSQKFPFANMPAEEVERRIISGEKPPLDKLPIPKTSKEAEIMSATRSVLENGWISSANARQTARFLYDNFADLNMD